MARGKSYAKPGNRFVTGERMKVLNENVTYNTPLLPSSFPRIHLSISPGKRVNSYFPGALTFDTWENPKIPCLPLSIYHLYLFIYKKKKEKRKGKEKERNENCSSFLLLESADVLCRIYLYARGRVTLDTFPIPIPTRRNKGRVQGSVHEREEKRRARGNNTSGMNSNRQRSACFLKHE